MDPISIATASLTILTAIFLYPEEKRNSYKKKLSFGEWFMGDGFMICCLIGTIYYILISGIDARTNWSISGYPPLRDEETGMQYPM
jgi:hypothetical protein